MNKIVLVTGGLSGIGKGAVMELAKKHYKIIILTVTTTRPRKSSNKHSLMVLKK